VNRYLRWRRLHGCLAPPSGLPHPRALWIRHRRPNMLSVVCERCASALCRFGWTTFRMHGARKVGLPVRGYDKGVHARTWNSWALPPEHQFEIRSACAAL
jgi:hypothetical protein